MKQVELAGLTVRLAGGVDRDGGGEGPLVVLLHGFGAPGDDLVSLGRVIDAPEGTRWAFPAAPRLLDASPDSPWAYGGLPGARAWWMIDLPAMQLAMETGQSETMAREEPPGLEEARDRVDRLLDAMTIALRPSSIVLGGFSQGAMLACDVALRTRRQLAGIVLCSTTLVAADTWAGEVEHRRGLPVFQSHGAADPLLPFAYAERVRDLLRGGGLEVTWAPFRGGHEIPDRVLHDLGSWLRRVLV